MKKKSRNKDGENVSYQQQQESYVGTPYAESYREEYQDDDEEQEHEEDEVEQVEEQSKGSHSIASLESKYARMYNQEFTNNIAADPPAQPMERTAPTAVVANVSAPYPRYTPKVRTSNYQDQYLPSTTQTNQPNISAPNVTPAMLSGTAPYPKWSPPASLKNYQENSAPLYSNTQQDNSAIPPSIPPARPSSHSVSPSMGNGYAKYQANQFPLASQEEVPKRATPDEAEPENTPSTLPIDPRNVPGQATYKWQPPALLKQFQDANSNDSFDPQTNISPSYSQPPTSQPQYVLPQPVTPQTHAPATMKPGISTKRLSFYLILS